MFRTLPGLRLKFHPTAERCRGVSQSLYYYEWAIVFKTSTCTYMPRWYQTLCLMTNSLEKMRVKTNHLFCLIYSAAKHASRSPCRMNTHGGHALRNSVWIHDRKVCSSRPRVVTTELIVGIGSRRRQKKVGVRSSRLRTGRSLSVFLCLCVFAFWRLRTEEKSYYCNLRVYPKRVVSFYWTSFLMCKSYFKLVMVQWH